VIIFDMISSPINRVAAGAEWTWQRLVRAGWLRRDSVSPLAEIELSVLSSQCLDRRIATQQRLTEEMTAWEAARNKHHAKAEWQFTTADARTKLKRLYPPI
jgi:hypothetical protein